GGARQSHRKRAAPSGLALYPQRASVLPHDELDDTQPQAAPAGLAGQPPVHLVEAAEDPLLLARGDADAVIFYREHHRGVALKRAEGDLLFARRVLVGVVEQVEQDAHERLAVAPYQGETGRDTDLQAEIRRLPSLPGGLQCELND